MGGGAGQVLKRIPRIKFPQRHTQSSTSATANTAPRQFSMSKSDVPAPPSNTAVGGKASLQPKRTPVTDREIEAIQLGAVF
ncbi:hypothetical protein Tsubulata_020948 [Turnera subulata]|uniref:Uncharacterized protein n=1 Tax=Turnera subulata TaxID=218843 RepID=A0A9Q0IZP0_9ROSI|nr:hypothetical protein Tsubulata_020948 [Turnera subulata]